MQPVFRALQHDVARLTLDDVPRLKALLERCGDYYELAEGKPADRTTAIAELTEGPPERVPHDLLTLGILDGAGGLAGFIGGLRHHRRRDQYYLGLMLIDPAHRSRGLGAAAYGAFEDWLRDEGGNSLLLAVIEKNVRAGRFWERMGFGWPRCYPERTIGLRRHVLIEYEKTL